MFKRKIYDKMLEWKKESDGRTALLIEGARRIGKSTVAEEFARNEYESYILIDFSIAPKATSELFEDISDLDYLFLQLQLQFKVDLIERKSVIIFDEVQKCPLARQAIKHLVKDHRYDSIPYTGIMLRSAAVKHPACHAVSRMRFNRMQFQKLSCFCITAQLYQLLALR